MVAQQVSRAQPDPEKTRRLLLKLFQTNTYTVDCAYVDAGGKMVVVAPKQFAKHEGKDISSQPQVAEVRRSRKPVASKVFLSVEGFRAMDYEYPVFSSRKEWMGSVSMLIKPDAMLNRLLGPFAREGAELWVLQPDGLVLYAQDAAEIGRNVLSDERYQANESFVEFAQEVCRDTRGEGSFDLMMPGFGKPGIKESTWQTVAQDGLEWRVVSNAPFRQ